MWRIAFLTGLVLVYKPAMFAQTTGSSFQIQWTDSISIGTKPFYIYNVEEDSMGTVVQMAANDKHYHYFKYKDTAFRVAIPSAHKSKHVWSNPFQSGIQSLSLSPAMLGRSHLVLKDSSGSESNILTFKNNFDHPAQWVVEYLDSQLFVFVLPGLKLNDSAHIFFFRITNEAVIHIDTICPPWQSLRPRLIHFEFVKNRVECLFSLHKITPSEKRGFKRNYHFSAFSFSLNTNESAFRDLPISDHLFYPTIKPTPDAQEYFGTYGDKSGKISQGIFIIAGNSIRHIPFPPWLLKEINKNRIVLRKKITALYPDTRIINGNDTLFIFEQYFLSASGGTASNPLFDFHYNHIILMRISGDQIQFSYIPKKQVTMDDFGQISSYNLIKSGADFYILFNSGKKYLKNPGKTYRNRKIAYNYIVKLSAEKQVSRINHRSIPILTHLNKNLGDGKYRIYGRKGAYFYLGELIIGPPL